MSEKTRFWTLVALLTLSIALLWYLNYADKSVFIGG